ncbi:MAG: LuxR C-terminal-related transcriptional regulator [Chloroflexota bacterium]|nr:LuxR C-terminal-related transcriptional regulator [Chloroflexota bacterium]
MIENVTEREREVLEALCQRLSYKEIADQLFISPLTVKRHASSVYSKLGVAGRNDAVRMARELGWLT